MVVGVHDWQGCVINRLCVLQYCTVYRNGVACSEIVIPLINITVEICAWCLTNLTAVACY